VIRYMLDTNVCVGLLRSSKRSNVRRIRLHNLNELCLSVITLAELLYGVSKSTDQARNEKAVVDFCAALEIAPFDSDAAAAYGQIRSQLERRGQSIGPLDTLIAAHALAMDVTLITNNARDFQRVSNLRIENWSPI